MWPQYTLPTFDFTKRSGNRKLRTPLAERFWKLVEITDDCWIWTGATDKKGYGTVYDGNSGQLAHRISWAFEHGGLIPEGTLICHRCDNPPCVRPDHLFSGTYADNAADMKQKGRWNVNNLPRTNQGEKNHKAKLLNAEVLQLVSELRSGNYTHQQLAERWGVCPATVSHISAGRAWSSVTGIPQLRRK